MPKVPEVLAPRRKSRQIKVGKVLVGGDAQVAEQGKRSEGGEQGGAEHCGA